MAQEQQPQLCGMAVLHAWRYCYQRHQASPVQGLPTPAQGIPAPVAWAGGAALLSSLLLLLLLQLALLLLLLLQTPGGILKVARAWAAQQQC